MNSLSYSEVMNIFIGLQKYLHKDLFKISKLELHLISLGSEFQNLRPTLGPKLALTRLNSP